MSEIPAPYNFDPRENLRKVHDVEKIAYFLDSYIGFEMLEVIPCPKHLDQEYDDMTDALKNEWYEYTLNYLLKDINCQLMSALNRPLKAFEANLVKKRLIDYFTKSGIHYKK